jgi:hypothetical protein
LGLVQRLGIEHVARQFRTTDVCVRLWVSGKRRPLYSSRKKALALFGIETDAWDVDIRPIKQPPVNAIPQVMRAVILGDLTLNQLCRLRDRRVTVEVDE